ncbi:unnamed protein product [Caenorhabditis auriculariae]|uniref:Uncharacterized protein n=1 Tax=Caenorhabditis auriculariae TaxID=2777116 RepID=A0A8S1GY19_9PELO|nr:unnamed protein product [Caenorhabditis auriculariae]
MSRLRSDTFIKPGSESSFDSEELSARRLNDITGCGITMVDIGLAFFPIISGTIAVSFLTFALVHHSAVSLKPFIIHQVIFLIVSISIFAFYILLLFRQPVAVNFINLAANYSSTALFLSNVAGVMRLVVGFLFVAQISVNVFCLHIALGLYMILDNVVRYVSADCTEVI